MDNPTDCDLLSDLPLNIIHSILTLIPIRDAVRTCILSKKWRCIWTSLPHLVFDSLSLDGRIEFLVTMVNHVLFSHQGPLQKFELLCNSLIYRFPNHPDLWLSVLSTMGIQELSLDIYSEDGTEDYRFQVHSSLYSCRKLTHLKLSGCELPPPLDWDLCGFSCLRSLQLFRVKVPCDVVESLVANSPLLEEFMLNHFEVPEMRISAPNLKRLHLEVGINEISLYAPLVDDLSVTLMDADFTTKHQSSVCNYIKFLGGFTNLKQLKGYGEFVKFLSIGIESYNHSLVFHHLKSISLYFVCFEDKKQIAVVGHLIRGAPNLQVLEIFPKS